MIGIIKTQPRGLRWDGYAEKRQAVRRERRNPAGGQCLEWRGLKIACCRQTSKRSTMEDGTRAERRLVGCRRANDIYPVGPARLRLAGGLGTPSCQVDAGVLDGGRTADDFRSRCKLHTRSSGWVGILGKTRLWRLWCGARHTANPLTHPGKPEVTTVRGSTV
jgi:hypothetical protein